MQFDLSTNHKLIMHQEPVGYSATVSGLLGACLLLSGLVAAAITAPLFDRVFTHHLALSIKILVPPLAGAWLSLIWAGKISSDVTFGELADCFSSETREHSRSFRHHDNHRRHFTHVTRCHFGALCRLDKKCRR